MVRTQHTKPVCGPFSYSGGPGRFGVGPYNAGNGSPLWLLAHRFGSIGRVGVGGLGGSESNTTEPQEMGQEPWGD